MHNKSNSTKSEFSFLSRQNPMFYVFGVDSPSEYEADMQTNFAVDSLLHTCIVFGNACNDILQTKDT